MMTRTQAAFCLSVNRLFAKYEKIYFWTFTFKRVMSDWSYPIAWNALMLRLRDLHGGFLQGLRVIEVHPAEHSHGLHYHCLLNQRVGIHLMRREAAKFGFGRIHVAKHAVDPATAYYLAKYLGKESELTHGMRRWGTIGGFKACSCRQVQIDSAFHRNMRKLCHGKQTTFQFACRLRHLSELHGEWEEWPDAKREDMARLRASEIRSEQLIQARSETEIVTEGLTPFRNSAMIYAIRQPVNGEFTPKGSRTKTTCSNE